MDKQSLAAAMVKLTAASAQLRTLLDGIASVKMRARPKPGVFSPLEDAWHLRDIEREGFLVRIKRILTEDVPVLRDLDGDQMAIDRRYNELEPAAATADFARARAESLMLLQELPPEAWLRRAHFAHETIDLWELINRMVDHDQGHLSSIGGVYMGSIAA